MKSPKNAWRNVNDRTFLSDLNSSPRSFLTSCLAALPSASAAPFLFRSPTTSLKFLPGRPEEHGREAPWAWHWNPACCGDAHMRGRPQGQPCARPSFHSDHSCVMQVPAETIGGSTWKPGATVRARLSPPHQPARRSDSSQNRKTGVCVQSHRFSIRDSNHVTIQGELLHSFGEACSPQLWQPQQVFP